MKRSRLYLTILLIFCSFLSMAANRYWIANSASNWNNTANWSTTSGGAGGASVPGPSDVVYFDANGTGTCTLDVNASVAAVVMSAGTLDLATYNFTISGSSNSTFSGGTVNGSTIMNITPAGSARVLFSGTVFNVQVHVVSPRIALSGSTFNNISYFEKTGSVNDIGSGGNTFIGNCTIKNTGSGYLRMGNSSNDVFSADLTFTNEGSSSMQLAYNNSTSVGGNLIISSGGASTRINLCNASTSSVSIAGNCTVTNSSSASNYIRLGYRGSFTVGGNLSITNGGTGDNRIRLAENATSVATIGGTTTVVNNDTAATHRIFLGYQGDVTFNGPLYIRNNSNANNSQVYCNFGSSSNNTYNDNILLEVTNSKSDGILFGNNQGHGVLASGKTISIGSGGYIAGYLQFRNFTQNGTTAQSLTLTGTAIFYNYNSSWGGDVNFTAPRMYTRGTTYNGTCRLEKTGAGGDLSYGDNTFKGNTEIVNSGSSYIAFGNGGTDDFQAKLTLTNTGSSIYIARHSPGVTNIAGDFSVNNNSASSTAQIFVSVDSISSVVVGGATTVTNNAAGTNKRIYLGYNGDVTYNGSLTITNSSTATNSHVYLNYAANSHSAFNENIVLSSTNANTDGVYFGYGGGSATLAATKTVSLGTFTGGTLYFKNFTQTGNTAHTFNLPSNCQFYSFSSDWGGNIHVSAGGVTTTGTTYRGTAYLEKTGGGSNSSHGGNTFMANTELVNSGSASFTMGNTNGDDFQANLIIRNTGTGNFYLANSSAGNQIANDLTIYNSAGYFYVNNSSSASLSIGGNCTITQTGSGSNSRVFFNDDGNLTLAGNLNVTNNTSVSSYFIVSSASTATTTIGGTTTITNSGSGTRSYVFLGNAGDVTFNGDLIIHNSSDASGSSVYLNQYSNSANTYNGNITLESSVAGCDGVYFGGQGGTGVLASGKTISIGGAGFISGSLYIRNLTQQGTTPQALTITGSTIMTLYGSDWGGNVTFAAPRLVVRDGVYRGTAFLEKTGASNDAGAGGNKFYMAVTFKNSGSGSLTLGSGNADTTLSDVTLLNTGSAAFSYATSGANHIIGGDLTINNAGSNGDFYLCSSTSSSLVVNGNTTIVNSGAGTYHRVFIGNNGDITFNGSLDISNSCTASHSAIYLNNGSSSQNTYTENIYLENTNTNSDGIFFGNSGGSGTLASGKTITIKSGGFVAGSLYLRNFTQTGNTPQSLTLTGSATLHSRSADWGGNINFKAPRFYVSGSTFHGTVNLEKTGAGNDNSPGGNTYMKQVVFAKSGSGTWTLGNGTHDVFNGNVVLNNSGSNDLNIAYRGAGHSIAGDLEVNNTSTDGDIYIAYQSTATLTVGGKTTVVNSGAGTNHRVYLALSGDVTFNGDIDISNSSTASNNQIYIGNNTTTSDIIMKGNLAVENTSTDGDGIFIQAKTATLAASKTISIKSGGFVAGNFLFRNFTKLGTDPVTLQLTPSGTARIYSYKSTWGGNVNFIAPRLYLYMSSFNGSMTYLEKTGDVDDRCYGGNTFAGDVKVVNSSASYYLMMSNTVADIFQGDLTLTNSGSDDLYLGNASPGITIAGILDVENHGRNVYIASGSASTVSVSGSALVKNYSTLSSANIYFANAGELTVAGNVRFTNSATGASGQIIIGNGNNSKASFGGNLILENQGSGTTKQIFLGEYGIISVAGELEIKNTATATNSNVYCNRRTGSIGTYNDNIIVSASGTNCDGIYFGYYGGTVNLASGVTMSIGAGGYTDGRLYLRNVTQSGSAPVNLQLTSNARLDLYNSTWGGQVNMKAPIVTLRANTFNSSASLEKTGSGNIANYGGNVYNGNASLTNSGSGYWRLAGTAGNDYNANVLFNKSSSGAFIPAFAQHSTIAGNLSFNSNSDFTIGYYSGSWLEFDGTGAQSINNAGAAHKLSIRRLKTNNASADITLNTPVSIISNLNLTQGNIISSTSNMLTMNDNAVVDAVSDNAYVVGPMKKIGNDAFTFPVGGTDTYGNSHYAGIGISAPPSASHQYVAEYHAAGHTSAATFSAPLTKVSLVEYWDLERPVGTGSINVYLYWGDGTRSGIGSLTDLRVAHWNGTTWEDKGNAGTSGSVASGSIAATGISTFSPFTFGTVDNVQNPLPIELLSFDVKKEEHSVRIDWATASETNNDYFIIERTDDFNNIELVQTVKGAGNSNQELHYYIYDNQPLIGTSYYRLIQVDFDGKKEVFEWKSVSFEPDNVPTLSVYPNPSSGRDLNISLFHMKGKADLRIMDISGRIVFSESLVLQETNTIIPVNLDLTAGVYFVQVRNSENTLSQRIVVK